MHPVAHHRHRWKPGVSRLDRPTSGRKWSRSAFAWGPHVRYRDQLAGSRTSKCFRIPKIRVILSPTKGDSEPRRTENLSDIFLIPRVLPHQAGLESGGNPIHAGGTKPRNLWGEQCAIKGADRDTVRALFRGELGGSCFRRSAGGPPRVPAFPTRRAEHRMFRERLPPRRCPATSPIHLREPSIGNQWSRSCRWR